MKNSLKLIIILISIILLTSCGKSEADIKQEKKAAEKKANELKEEQLGKANEKAISDLYLKYGMVKGWENVDTFTYTLQEMYLEKGKTMVFEGELKDITKSDDTYFLIVEGINEYYGHNNIANISLDSEKFNELRKHLKSKSNSLGGCFVFKVSNIISPLYQIKSGSESDGEECRSFLKYSMKESLLIFKGDLIEFYINKSL